MNWQRAKVKGPLGIGGEIEKEAQTVKSGCVRYFEREIKGVKVLVMIVNRKDGFKILMLNNDGETATLYGGDEDGE